MAVNPEFAGAGGAFALVAGFILFVLVAMFFVYIYTSLTYYLISKKAKQKYPGLAWIPGIGPAIVAYQASGMHWWPFLLLGLTFIPFLNLISPLAYLVFGVFFIIWNWKLFESIGKPNWWAILLIIPIVGFVIIGIVAWSKD